MEYQQNTNLFLPDRGYRSMAVRRKNARRFGLPVRLGYWADWWTPSWDQFPAIVGAE